MQVDGLTLLGRYPPFLGRNDPFTHTVLDGLAVGLHPLTDLLEAVDSRSRQSTRSFGADVEKEVCIATCGLDEQADKGRIRLVGLVDDLVAPHAIHRLAGLDGELTDSLTREPSGVGTGDVTLKHLEVFAWVYFTVVVIPDEAGGVELVDPSVHLIEVPLEAWVDILVPFTVEPNSFGVVVADEFGELGVHKGIIRLPLPVLSTTRTLACTPDGVVVIAVPVKE